MSELVYLPVSELYPHPHNPRKNVDNLEELAASIKANGVLQNLTVIKGHFMSQEEWIEISKQEGVSKEMAKATFPADENFVPGGYTVIIGHRRLAAAKLAGLTKVPCTIASMSAKEQIQTMLLENMQRKDLKVYEEAQGFQMLLDFGDTVEEVSDKSGFSATTIRRRVQLTKLDQKKLKEVVDSRQIPLGDFEKLAQIEDAEERNELLDYIGTSEFAWKINGAVNRQAMRKCMPDVTKWLKKNKINKLPPGKEYDSQYNKQGDYEDYKIIDWPAALKKIGKLKEGKKYFYNIDDYTCKLKLYLYTPTEKVKRTKEEIEEGKRINKAWEYLDRKSYEMFEKRKAFIDGLKVTSKNEVAVLHGAVLRTMAASFYYVYYNNSNFFPLLGIECGPNTFVTDKWEDLFAAYQKHNRENLAKIIYLTWGDEEKRLPTEFSYRKAWPEWRKNRIMVPLYDWLVSLGYEMSQMEKDLMTGKAKIYEKDCDEFDEATASGEAAD